jgi:hypothetical protein
MECDHPECPQCGGSEASFCCDVYRFHLGACGRRSRGTGCLSSAVLQRSHEPRATGPHHLLLFQARPPPRGPSRVRSRLDGRREVAPVRAGFAGVLPDRAVLSLFRPRRQALPSTDLARALALARGAPVVVPFDDDRSSRAAVAGRWAAAAPAGRAPEGKGLAQDQGQIAARNGPQMRHSGYYHLRRDSGPERGNPSPSRLLHRFPRRLSFEPTL